MGINIVVGTRLISNLISLRNACSVWETHVAGWSWEQEMQLRYWQLTKSMPCPAGRLAAVVIQHIRASLQAYCDSFQGHHSHHPWHVVYTARSLPQTQRLLQPPPPSDQWLNCGSFGLNYSGKMPLNWWSNRRFIAAGISESEAFYHVNYNHPQLLHFNPASSVSTVGLSAADTIMIKRQHCWWSFLGSNRHRTVSS